MSRLPEDYCRLSFSGTLPAVDDRGEADFHQLLWECQTCRADDCARTYRPVRAVSRFANLAGNGEGRLEIRDVNDLIDHVIQGRAELGKHPACVFVCGLHLERHVRAINNTSSII